MASTIRDVAARAGLSVGTVSKLFFHLVGHWWAIFYKLCKFIKSHILSKSPLNALVISI